jgi:uncharacterized protein YoxC
MSTESSATNAESDRIETTNNGVTVTKRLRRNDRDITLVVYTISSTRSDEVSVEIDEPLPDEFPVNKVGLHPEYLREKWDVSDEGMVFEARLAPEAEIVTLYGVDVPTVAEARPFLTEPAVKTSIPLDGAATSESNVDASDVGGDGLASDFLPDSPADANGTTARDPPATDGGATAADVESPETDAVEEQSGATDEPADDAPDGSAPADATATRDSATPVDDDSGESTGSSADSGGPVGSADGSAESTGSAGGSADPVTALVESLDGRTLTDHERSVLVDALGVKNTKTMDARLRRVQQTVEDLAAYEDALADFIESNGGASEVIEEFRTELDAVRDVVEDLTERLEETRTDVESLDENVSEISDRVASLGESVDALEDDHDDDVAAVRDELSSLEATVEDVSESHESALSSLEADVEACRDWQRTLSEAVEAPPATAQESGD